MIIFLLIFSSLSSADENTDPCQEFNSKLSSAPIRTQSELACFIEQNGQRFNAEYVAELLKNPTIEGTISIVFTINPDGSVGLANIATNKTNSNALGESTLEIIRTIRWPARKVEKWTGEWKLNFFSY